MSWIAEYDTQGREFPTCVHVTKTTGTMTHGATYVSIEDGKAVRAENAKLRTLIGLKETCWKYVGWCDECPYNGVDDEHDDCNCTVQERISSLARELGIEVDA